MNDRNEKLSKSVDASALAEQDAAARRHLSLLDEARRMQEPHASPEKRAEIGDALYIELAYQFQSTLTPADAEAWRLLCNDPPSRMDGRENSDRVRLAQAIEDFVSSQIRQCGIALFSSADVQRMNFSW